jgi:ComF family protein
MPDIRRALKDTGREVLQILYPAHCPICHGIAPYHEAICPECRKKLPYIRGKRCRLCGKPVEDSEIYCDDCQKIRHFYQEGMGIFLYDDVMRETMSYLKYKHRKEYGRILGELVYEAAREKIRIWNPQAIIPVPMHKSKMETRGYNQAEEIARPIAERFGVPLCTDLLFRREKTAAMKDLSAVERRDNMRHAFAVSDKNAVPKRILLVDDIYTTGATIDACAEALRAAGAGQITFLTVCIGMGFMVRY